MTESLQHLIRLLAQYRDRLDRATEADTVALLRALIAEIETAPRDGAPPET